MASTPNSAPVLFDRALLAKRQERARKLGPAAFLLDRAVGDMEERLGAVRREFADAADIWTPGEGFSHPTRFKSLTRIVPPDSLEVLALPPESLDLAISALALVRQRSARRASANPPRAEAGRATAGGDDRR